MQFKRGGKDEKIHLRNKTLYQSNEPPSKKRILKKIRNNASWSVRKSDPGQESVATPLFVVTRLTKIRKLNIILQKKRQPPLC